MPYTYTCPHEPLRLPPWLDPQQTRWVILVWAVTAAAGLAAAAAAEQFNLAAGVP